MIFIIIHWIITTISRIFYIFKYKNAYYKMNQFSIPRYLSIGILFCLLKGLFLLRIVKAFNVIKSLKKIFKLKFLLKKSSFFTIYIY